MRPARKRDALDRRPLVERDRRVHRLPIARDDEPVRSPNVVEDAPRRWMGARDADQTRINVVRNVRVAVGRERQTIRHVETGGIDLHGSLRIVAREANDRRLLGSEERALERVAGVGVDQPIRTNRQPTGTPGAGQLFRRRRLRPVRGEAADAVRRLVADPQRRPVDQQVLERVVPELLPGLDRCRARAGVLRDRAGLGRRKHGGGKDHNGDEARAHAQRLRGRPEVPLPATGRGLFPRRAGRSRLRARRARGAA